MSAKRRRDAGTETLYPSSSLHVRPRQTQLPSTPTRRPAASVVIDLTGDEPTPSPKRQRKNAKNSQSPANAPPSEKRLRRFRDHPPSSFLQRLRRAVTQRMFVVGQDVKMVDGSPVMTFDVIGSTGNMYQTIIRKEPSCSCPDNEKGNQCKHILYVLVNVLKAPEHLQYQLAFLSSELSDIYQRSSLKHEHPAASPEEDNDNHDGKRKPIEGDCPICFMEFEAPDPAKGKAKDDIVWCRAECGQNVHKACFQKWAAVERRTNANSVVRCVCCRTPWQATSSLTTNSSNNPDVDTLRKSGYVNEEGYLNVGGQMGLPEDRGMKPSLYFYPLPNNPDSSK